MQGCADWTDIFSFLPALGVFGRNARKLGQLDDAADGAKNATNAALRNNGRARNNLGSALSCSTSFVAGTEVLTPDGLVII